MKELIVVKQLPIIEQQLKTISEDIDKKVESAASMVCTEETVKTIKELRASLNKEYKEFEGKRKIVKEQILKPYNDFEEIYKKCISDKFKNADLILKSRVELVENELKSKKEQEVKEYFEEYKKANAIDFITYDQAKINVTLSASLKSLKEQAKQFIDQRVDDLKLIDTQEHKTEILVEYKQTLNVSNSITSVNNRFKAIEEEKKKQEELSKKVFICSSIKDINSEDKGIINDFVQKSQERDKEVLQAPVVEEKQYTLKFTVKATKTKLVELKKFLSDGGYIYE